MHKPNKHPTSNPNFHQESPRNPPKLSHVPWWNLPMSGGRPAIRHNRHNPWPSKDNCAISSPGRPGANLGNFFREISGKFLENFWRISGNFWVFILNRDRDLLDLFWHNDYGSVLHFWISWNARATSRVFHSSKFTIHCHFWLWWVMCIDKSHVSLLNFSWWWEFPEFNHRSLEIFHTYSEERHNQLPQVISSAFIIPM